MKQQLKKGRRIELKKPFNKVGKTKCLTTKEDNLIIMLMKFLIISLFFISACQTSKEEEATYTFSYEDCKLMESDKTHRNWNDPAAVKTCQQLIHLVESPQ